MGRRLLPVLTVLLAVLGVTLAVWAQRSRHDQHTSKPAAARAVVVEYLHALEARNRSGILKLVPDGYEAAKDIDERLQRFGGAHAAEADIRITADISPEVLSASIRTVGPDGRELSWTENLFWREGAWWIVLGGRDNGRRASDTQRPSP